ncbi:hypothetical protein [uncultured Nostoc sp.]|uniref:hypothetical protein n=1 Tax=uncultured Nostoc sp. TaxID=340711 RepID=UPI0035CA77D6
MLFIQGDNGQATDGSSQTGCVAKTGGSLAKWHLYLLPSATDTRSMNLKHPFKWRNSIALKITALSGWAEVNSSFLEKYNTVLKQE